MASGSNYKSVFKQFGAKVASRSLAVAQDVATELAAKVIVRTPEDTSRARANWGAELNSIPQEFDESKRDPGGQASMERAKAIAAQMRLGSVFVIANSAPYIGRLENGYSQQAPAGMRDITVAEFPRIVARAIERRVRGRG